MAVLDQDPEEFRQAGYRAIDWIVEYFRTIDGRRVLSDSAPGSIAASVADAAPEQGRSYEALLESFERDILPGVTHWNHPAFFAYFAITGSRAGILGELLSAALNVNGMLWRTSPAATELEVRVLEWLARALGLPEGLFGIINDTASINTFLAIAAAREATGLDIRTQGMTGRTLPQLRVYCSDQAHSSVDKGALALGFGMNGITRIASDESFRMRVDALEEAIARDRAEGVIPCCVVATTGTTSTAAIDPVAEIARVARREGTWLHVDAAYGGSATINEKYRSMWDGIELADSIVVNPHKWLFTPVDCSVLYTKRPEVLRETFSLIPEYLKTPETDVVNYMDYGLQLGRRFRALKLWMVLEHYGTKRIAERIGEHVGYAERLAAILTASERFELIAPQSLGVVVFRAVVRDEAGAIDEAASERETSRLLETMNASGEVFVSHTRLGGRYGIRVAIGNGGTEWRHIQRILRHLGIEE